MQCALPCLARQCQLYLQILVLLTVEKEWAAVPAHWMIKSTRSSSNSRSCHYSHTLSQSMAAVTTKVTSVEQVVGGPAARDAALEAGAVSSSSVSGSAGSWPLPGQVDGSTPMGSHDPRSSEEGMNTRRRHDKF